MLALLPDGGPTGYYFDRTEVAEFWFSCFPIAPCPDLTYAAWIL